MEGYLAAEEAAAALTGGAEGGGGGGDAGGGSTEAKQRLVKQLRDMIRSGVTEDCSICLDDLNTPVITPCAHVYCRPCIEKVHYNADADILMHFIPRCWTA